MRASPSFSGAGVSFGGSGVHVLLALPYLKMLATEEQKARYFPNFVSGEEMWALAMTDVQLSCVVPLASLEVRWDEERSERMFEHIRKDTVGDIPKALCQADGGIR